MKKRDLSPKSRYIKFRVSEEEYLKIKLLAKMSYYNNLSQYIRDCILEPTLVIEDISQWTKVSNEVNAIGKNINQIAKYVNTNRAVDRALLVNLLEEHEKVKGKVNGLWKKRQFEIKYIFQLEDED